MVQERFNTEWILARGVGVVLHSFSEIATGILPMLDPEGLALFRERIAEVRTRAVFEIPRIMESLLRNPRALDSDITLSESDVVPGERAA